MQLTISGQIGSLDAKSSLKVQNHIAFDKQKNQTNEGDERAA
jgi:hypothetical protein